MRLAAKILVNPVSAKRMDEKIEKLAGRIRAGTEKAARTTLLEPLRADVKGALKSRKLPTTWRLEIYPKDETVHTLNPAAFVFSKAPSIIAAFEKGVTIQPTGGRQYLWIPTENVPTTTGGAKITPKIMARKVGGFRFARGRNNTRVAYANVAKSEGRAHKRGAKRKTKIEKPSDGKTTEKLAFYILVPQVSLKKRLNVAGIVQQAFASWKSELENAVAQAS